MLWHCLIFDCIFFKHRRQPHSAAPLQLATTAVVSDPSTQRQGTFNGELAMVAEGIRREPQPHAPCSCAQPLCCKTWHPGTRQPENTLAPGLGVNPLPHGSERDGQDTRSSRSLQGHKEAKTPTWGAPLSFNSPKCLTLPQAPLGHAPGCPWLFQFAALSLERDVLSLYHSLSTLCPSWNWCRVWHWSPCCPRVSVQGSNSTGVPSASTQGPTVSPPRPLSCESTQRRW